MKIFLRLAVAALLLIGFGVVNAARADDAPAAQPAPKEITVKGTMVCAKCALHQTTDCTNALKVKDGDKETIYYLVNNDVSKAKHDDVCHASKDNVTVTGTVEEKDGKMWITASKIEE